MKNQKAMKMGLIALLAGSGLAVAGPMAPAPAPYDAGKKQVVIEEPKTFCDIFDLATIYEDESNPYIQEISFIGRYHGQYHASSYDFDGDSRDDAGWENRRWRWGVEVKFLQNFEFVTQWNLATNNAGDDGGLFQTFDEIAVEWSSGDFYVIVGKQKPKVTREYSTSSKRIKTIERSQLVNQTVPDKLGGVTIGHDNVAGFEVSFGIFDTSFESDRWELPGFNGQPAYLFSMGRQVTPATHARFDWFRNTENGTGSLRGVEHEFGDIFSFNTLSEWGRLSLVTDIIYADYDEDNADPDEDDVFGIVIMPYYQLTDTCELVFRYTFSTSDGVEGVRHQSRYERGGGGDDDAGFGVNGFGDDRGEEYHAFYLGLNKYICGDKFKFMNGIEYATMDTSAGDQDVFTFFSGVRVYW